MNEHNNRNKEEKSNHNVKKAVDEKTHAEQRVADAKTTDAEVSHESADDSEEEKENKN